mgnify:CR=1 FL=1
MLTLPRVAAAAKSDLGDVFDQLDLNDEEFDDVEIEEDDLVLNESVCWLALARISHRENFPSICVLHEYESDVESGAKCKVSACWT